MIITVLHLVEHITNCFDDGSSFSVKIEYFIEKTLFGNADTLFKIRNKLAGDFLLTNVELSGYLAVVITNQSVIARGEVTYEQLQEIHNKMEALFGMHGVYILMPYTTYCPHHPHKGYEGEIPELKIECECRKPKPGILLKAAEDFNIDHSQSWLVSDDENDIKAGNNARCRTALIGVADWL